VLEITDTEVADIYEEYWRDAHCSYMPEPLDLLMLDAAINHGPKRAVKLLQRALGIDEDGVCGRDTMAALHEEVVTMGIEAICDHYLNVRLGFYDKIIENDPSQAVFAKGWTNRVGHLREAIA
jgi:lysozyme family protein